LPKITINILEPIAGWRLSLKRSDGSVLQHKGGGPVGSAGVVMLKHPEGSFAWEGGLTVRYPNTTEAFMPLSFTTEFYGPLTLNVNKATGVDLEKRTVTFTLSRPAQKAKVTVKLDTGLVASDEEVPLNGAPAGSPLTVSWPEVKGTVLSINIQVFDTATYFAGVELLPWRIDIPHEEVQFPSGQATFDADQQSKLDDSMAKVIDAIRKYGKLAPIRLFVAGHTDSVGPTTSNRSLSLKRAQTIAGFFKSRLAIPVLYEGFGEEALAVPTPDEVAEVKNRRAEYIISIEEPVVTNSRVPAKWKRL
jgi:outer membrane protein OmpA-like peptidoglycan-associated protein